MVSTNSSVLATASQHGLTTTNTNSVKPTRTNYWFTLKLSSLTHWQNIAIFLRRVIPSHPHWTIDLLLYLVVVGLALSPDDGDGHPTAVPGHHHRLVEEGHSVEQTVLDVDVGGVPSLTNTQSQYQMPVILEKKTWWNNQPKRKQHYIIIRTRSTGV